MEVIDLHGHGPITVEARKPYGMGTAHRHPPPSMLQLCSLLRGVDAAKNKEAVICAEGRGLLKVTFSRPSS